jgi:hypothetical protein
VADAIKKLADAINETDTSNHDVLCLMMPGGFPSRSSSSKRSAWEWALSADAMLSTEA